MTDFKKHSDVLEALTKSQDADKDNRDRAREAHLFIDKRDGQWEPLWWNANKNKPRYTFDMTSPVVDQIAGEMDQADFSVTVKPAGGDTTKDDALLLDGLIRNIENFSDASDIYSLACRNMVTAGFDAWRVNWKFVDDDSFDKDIVIEGIPNAIDSVWFGPYKKPDASDVRWGIVLEAVTDDEYDERWPDGAKVSVSENRLADAFFNKRKQIIVGQIYYIDPQDRELLQMSSGRVLEFDKVKDVLDDLANPINPNEQPETVIKRRMSKKNIVKSRLFDGKDWLGPEQETVFTYIPVIPVMANFKIFENKILYRGVVEKLIDPQRVHNYAKSREIEEGALAPRRKWWMTLKQAIGFESEIATLNTNSDPVQFYNPDPEAPGAPIQNGANDINPGLTKLSEDMRVQIGQTAGLFAANMGDNPNLQSGIAIKRLQDKGDTGTIKYFKARERAQCHTVRIIIDAVPTVYDTPRQTRILKEDGSFDMTAINEPVVDQQTGTMVTTNDVTKGKYDVTCSAGPSFQNKQEETVAAITEIAAVMPEIMQSAADVMLNNISAPGMNLLVPRVREQLFNAGAIPVEQWTDEEKRKQLLQVGAIPPEQMTEDEQLISFIQQNQPPPPEDPAAILANAEVGKAQAEASKAEAQGQRVLVQAEADRREQDRKDFQATQDAQQQQFDNFTTVQESIVNQLSEQADTMKTLREAFGVDQLVGFGGLGTLLQQIQIVLNAQQNQQ